MLKSPRGLGKVRLVHEGTFDLNKIHGAITEWMDNREYDYSEKENAEKGARRGIESTIKLNGERNVTEHVLFSIGGEITTFEMKRKGKVQTGKIVVKLNAEVQLDYKGDWGKSKFLEFLLFLYHNTIFRPAISKYSGKADDEFNELQDAVKEAMELYA